MVRYYHAVDKRSRAQMVAYLVKHYRYNTMNSWNCSTSYACNMKIHHLGLEKEIAEQLYAMVWTDEFSEAMHDLRYSFAVNHGHRWQACMNGRSGGYLVLYEGELKPTGHKSYCTACGQHNFRNAAELAGCGRCGKDAMRDFPTPPMQAAIFSGRSIDMGEDFEDWSMDELRWRVDLVQSFDRLADEMVQQAIDYAKHFTIQEETYLVEQRRRVLVPSA